MGLWLLGSSAAASDKSAEATVTYYADTDAVSVLSPHARSGFELGRVELGVAAGADIITAASVDLVTGASPRGFREVRAQASTQGSYGFGEGRFVHAGYELSHEPDFITHQATVGATADVLARLATVSLTYALGHSDIGRKGDPAFWRRRLTHQAELGWSHVLSPTWVADLNYSFTLADGFLANPYRFVRLYAPGAELHETAVAESTPSLRVRQTLGGRLRARLLPGLFAVGDYRFYADSWGLRGHTGTLRATATVREGWDLTFEVRGHSQTQVDFYQPRYDTFPEAPVYRTAEKELGPMWTALVSAHLDYLPEVSWAESLRLGAGAELLRMRYPSYEQLPQRDALIAIVNLSWEH